MAYNKSCNIFQWYHFNFICVPTKFDYCSVCRSCDIMF